MLVTRKGVTKCQELGLLRAQGKSLEEMAFRTGRPRTRQVSLAETGRAPGAEEVGLHRP